MANNKVKDNGRISKERLNQAVVAVIRTVDQQRTNPLKALLNLEGKIFKIGECCKEKDTLVFRLRKEVSGKIEEDQFPRRDIIEYFIPEARYPILEADITVFGYGLSDDSKISFSCSEPILGYSILDKDDAGNYRQYRFFSSQIGKTNAAFRRQFKHLSQKLSENSNNA